MAVSVALLGAGGKMGFRVTKKLAEAGYDVRAVEIGETGKQRLAEAGIKAVSLEEGIPGAKVIVMALPDNIIGNVARQISPMVGSGGRPVQSG